MLPLVVDFAQFQEGDEVFLENRLLQVDGRGRKEVLPRRSRILKFIVEEAVDDPSEVPDELRRFDPIPQAELANATIKTFVFERQDGAWAINGQLATFAGLSRPRR